MIISNENIKNALSYACSKAGKGDKVLRECYTLNFWEGKKEITWDELCEYASLHTHVGCHYKIALGMLIYALENDIYNDKHKTKLTEELPILKRFLRNYNSLCAPAIFSKKYNAVGFFQTNNGHIMVRELPECNSTFMNLYLRFLGETINEIYRSSQEYDDAVVSSIQSISLYSYQDINGNVFWKQVDYLKKKYTSGEKGLRASIKRLLAFYRWLIKEYNDYDFFKDSPNLIKELFNNDKFLGFIIDGYTFVPYTNKIDLGDAKRTVFIVKNCDRYTTLAAKDDIASVNISNVENGYYRTLINKYLLNGSYQSIITERVGIYQIANTMHFLEELKKQKDYPNKELKYINSNEALLIRRMMRKSETKNSLSSINVGIIFARKFLVWCSSNGYLELENTFTDYLVTFTNKEYNQGKPIPDDELDAINRKFIELSKDNSVYKMYYALFLLLIETEFRISQICNLTVNSIQPSLKPDQFYVYSNSKTSHGKMTEQPISLKTKLIIDALIDETEDLRREAQFSSNKDRIFIYKNIDGFVVSADSSKFNRVLSEICKQLNIAKYSATNLRDTHMTKAFEYVLKNGKSDLELALLTKHRKVDTTTNHYVEIELTKMLESIYQISLNSKDINIEGKLLDDVPDGLKDKNNIVEDGCGYCQNSKCDMIGALPCVICKHFVTTISHKLYFEKMIKNIDTLLENTTIPHEKDDLNLMKAVYVTWLKEIYLKEETNKC